MYTSVFDKLIWCTIGPKSFLFGTAQFSLWASSTVNYDYIVHVHVHQCFYKCIHMYGTPMVNCDYIVTNSINSLLIGSRCIPNGAHTNHC